MKILFTSTLVTSFVREDLAVLGNHFTLDHLITRGISSVWEIPRRLRRADVTFTWMASTYSAVVVFFARRLGKPSIVVIGGADVAKYPEIDYGIWLNPWKALLVKYALRNADKILAVDPFQQEEAKRLARYDGTNIEYVPTGYDPSVWYPEGKKEDFILTVAACHDELRMKKKGLDILFEAARLMNSVHFVVIGIFPDLMGRIKHQIPRNVELIEHVEQREILRYYQRARVYCQPSYTEGLPNSLCEAMLCECIPVGTKVGGIPTAIADAGFLIPYGDVERLREALSGAMQAPTTLGGQARRRITEEFPRERRERSLMRVIMELAP